MAILVCSFILFWFITAALVLSLLLMLELVFTVFDLLKNSAEVRGGGNRLVSWQSLCSST